MDSKSHKKKHILIIGSLWLTISLTFIGFIAIYQLISPNYSDTMQLAITLHRGENIKDFSKKYNLKPMTTYGTKGTFYYPVKKGENFFDYVEEIKKLPEVETASLSPMGIPL